MSNPKRPRDPNQLAHLIGAIATGERPNDRPEPKNADRVKGGKSRAKNMTAEERKAVAEKAAKSRWKKD